MRVSHVLSVAGIGAGLCFASLPAMAQAGGVRQVEATGPQSPDGAWRMIEAIPADVMALPEYIRPDRAVPAVLDMDRAAVLLEGAPAENAYLEGADPVLLDLPMPDGTFDTFLLYETPIMAPGLAAKFPQIKTYAGSSASDGTAVVRVTVSHLGFDAFVMRAGPDIYVDRVSQGNNAVYTAYYGADLTREALEWSCGFDPDAVPQAGQRLRRGGDGSRSAAAQPPVTLRTFQTAIAATGEYTQFFGGSVADGLAGVVTSVNRVTGIYERDLSARLQLVPNNDLVIFTNPSTDPFSSSPSLSSIDSAIDSRIGSGNYDVGHLVDTGGGGYAQLGVVCTSSKGRGYTGLTPPTGDRFFVDYLAHELGHQFGGNHTFNGNSGSCAGGNRNGSTAYEPGSGSTIMGYADICGNDNLQSFSDDYFHWISLQEMSSHIASRSCDTETGTGNNTPTASVLATPITVPINTPFRLVGSGSDAEGDAITYTWEQADLGPQRDVNASDNGTSPIFRSFEGTTNPERIFPRLANWKNGTTAVGEQLPTVARTLDFRLTVRDNNPAGGGYGSASAQVVVSSAGGPFRVTSPNSPTTITDGQLTVTWDVAGTTASPFFASTVNILFSDDGAATFPYVLASGVANDGAQTVTLPGVITSQGYVMVESSLGTFLDINKAPITVDVPPEPVVITFPSGLPTELDEGEPTIIDVQIDPGTNTIDVAQSKLFYGFDGPAIAQAPLVPVGGEFYTATLPGGDCDELARFFFAVSDTAGNITASPETPGGTYEAAVVCESDCVVDVNNDGNVDGGDFFAWVAAFGNGGPGCDQNGDGGCNESDFFAFVANFGAGCP